VDNLELFRRFYQTYPELISDAVRRKSAAASDLPVLVPPESWQPGRLHPNLSWTHYRKLVRIEQTQARAFYEIESIKNHWVARELERQVDSLLYERLSQALGARRIQAQHPKKITVAIIDQDRDAALQIALENGISDFLCLGQGPSRKDLPLDLLEARLGRGQIFPALG